MVIVVTPQSEKIYVPGFKIKDLFEVVPCIHHFYTIANLFTSKGLFRVLWVSGLTDYANLR